MKLRPLALMTGLFLAACEANGPIFPVDDELYDWVKSPNAIDPSSDQKPVVTEPVVTFRLERGDRRSAIQTGEEWRVGQTFLLGFDVRLDPKSLGKENITLARLTRISSPKVEIASVQLDAERGVTVFGRKCIRPSDLSEWHRVEMRIKFSDKDTGYLEVFCDRKPIWARTKMRTNFAPECRLSEGCRTAASKPERYNWHLGLMTNTGVSRTIAIQMQRLHYRILLYKPNRVGTL